MALSFKLCSVHSIVFFFNLIYQTVSGFLSLVAIEKLFEPATFGKKFIGRICEAVYVSVAFYL